MTQLTSEDEMQCWVRWKENRDPEAGDVLAKKYMPLVSYHVQRISVGLPKNVSREELRSLGMMGLFNALERFDPSRDLKFDTYASFRIRGRFWMDLGKKIGFRGVHGKKRKRLKGPLKNWSRKK